MELTKTYNPDEAEDKIYRAWEKSGLFNPDKLEEAHDQYWNAEAFSIAMPPPNVTAELHLGSALFVTLQDLMTRHARMTGKKALWLPGTDHAAIATNYVVERKIWNEEKKTRHDLGREEFLRRVNEFIDHTKNRIQLQIRKMGASCDWSREKYTFSPELSLAVRTAFKRMYDAGLIYRGERIVNWCPRCGTTLADDEVIHRKETAENYFILYPFVNAEGGITVSTVRPETMVGDTAVAVHPDDARYKKFIGKSVMQPLVNREIPVIADPLMDKDYGTGAMKVTPAHDHHDFDLAEKNKLGVINVFNTDGKIDEKQAYDFGFEQYANLTTAEARKKIVEDLTTLGFLKKTEKTAHNISLCYRCETPVEPIVSKQWFIGVNPKIKIQNPKFREALKLPEEASLKEIAIAAVKSGAIKIIPERFEKTYLNWTENLRDWNISRQIWFGHQIPVWYCEACEEISVSVDPPKTCLKCGSAKLRQDPDTLDTWFSSGLWTFSTLGWPQETLDLKTYHPTNILETAYDILFFWVVRMVLMTGFLLEDIPFKTVYLHGLVRDISGKKMSKSGGNMINPLDVQAQYGTDALRLSLVSSNPPGNDMKFSKTKVESSRNFVNKLWNISRFILGNLPASPAGGQTKTYKLEAPEPQALADQWILSELESTISQVNKNFENCQYGLAAEVLYDFTWNKFADWYVEVSKIRNSEQILFHVLQNLLRLWHPFIPFVTEHIWSQFSKELLMIQEYPVEKPKAKSPASPTGGQNPKIMEQFSQLQELITGLRNLRSEYREAPGKILDSCAELPAELEWIKEQSPVIEKLARVKIRFEKMPEDKKMPTFLWHGAKIYLVLPQFDPKKEKDFAEKELKTIAANMAKLESQLDKKDFVKKAPAEVVQKMQNSLAELKLRAEKLESKIKSLK